jgi:hypothetical protein
VGDTSSKEFQILEGASGELKARNVVDGVDILKADSSTITDASGIKLNAHASRHGKTGADPIPDGALDRSQLKPLGSHFVKTASPTPGVNGSYGTPVDINAETNKSIVLLFCKLTWGGTFGTDESVNIRVTVTFSDTTTASVVKTATAVGDLWLSDEDKASLMKDGVYVTRVSVDSASSLSSTSVTTSATIYGLSI